MSPVPVLATAGVAALVSMGVAPVIRRWATRRGIVDDPLSKPGRSIHHRPIALLGGFAVAIGAAVAIFGAVLLGRGHAFPNIPAAKAVGVSVGVLLLLIGGYLDDRKNLPARSQILFTLTAALAAVLGGVAVEFITNPFGGVLRFDALRIPLPWLSSGLPLLGAVLTVGWLLVTTYAMKLLDGLDGLVSGIGVIAGGTLAALALRAPVLQGDTALIAGALSGACLGFLPWNWHPARQFLGEAGASGIGFVLGILAVIAGGKIATALLILGLPMLDVLWVMLRRTMLEGRSVAASDRKHLHHRLLDIGIPHRSAVLLLWSVTAVFGLIAVLTAGTGKLLALAALGIVMVVFAVVVSMRKPTQK